MVPRPNVAAKPLPVSTIDLERSGRANVTFRAPMTDTEHFYFTVPKTSMQTAIESLEVHDTRGGRPRVTFPAPLISRVSPLVLKKTSTWHDLLKRHQGAHVQLLTSSGPVEGYFIGFQHQRHEIDPHIVLQTDDNICMHDPETVSAVTFKGAEVAKKLERYTATLCREQEQDSVYRINITATGVGEGELCVSYTAANYDAAAFDFFYTIYGQEDDTDVNAKNEGASLGPTVRSKLRVKCYAVIRNPLHYDLNDVHFVLHTGRHRFYQENIYGSSEDADDDRSRSRSSTPIRRCRRRWFSGSRSPRGRQSPRRSRSPSPERGSPEQSLPSRSPSRSASSGDESDRSSEKKSEVQTVRSLSTTSANAHFLGASRELDVPDKISIKEGESMKVLLYETQIEGGVGHHCGYKGTQGWSVMLRNTTGKVLEPGLAMFFSKKLAREMNLPCFKPGENECFPYDRSGCSVKIMKSARRGDVLWTRVIGKQLVTTDMWHREQKYIIYNKEDEQIDVLVDYVSGEKTGCKAQLNARFYPEVSPVGDPEDEDSGQELDPYSKSRYEFVVSYKVRVSPMQRCAVVVNEAEPKLTAFPILSCTKEDVTMLEEMKLVGPTVAEKLGRFVDMRRKLARLRRTSRLHIRRLENLKQYEVGLVQQKDSSESKDEEDGNKQFFAAVNAAEDSMAEIVDAIDEIKSETVKLRIRIKAAKSEILDMDYVNPGDESDGNVPSTEI